MSLEKLPKLAMIRAMRQLLIWCLALGFVGACAKTTPQYSFNYAEKRMLVESNGLRVVVVPDSTTDLVEVDVRYEVGGAEDPQGKAGLAHLVEHVMFQLRPEGPNTEPFFKLIPRMATFFNAYTNSDSTHYMTQARKEFLEPIMRIEAMRLFYNCNNSNIPLEEFKREQEVVRNEIRLRAAPEHQIYPSILKAIFKQGHPYHETVGGDDMQLATITWDDVCKFWSNYYVPERATVIVTGNVTPEEIAVLIQKYFAPLPARKGAPRNPVTPASIVKQEKTIELDTERNSIHVAWAVPPLNTKDGKLAEWGLPSMNFHLTQFANDWDFAYETGAGIGGGHLAPIFIASIELKNENDRGRAMEFLWKAAKNTHRGFESGSFKTAKAKIKANYVKRIEQLSERTNMLGDIIQFDKGIRWNSTDAFFLNKMEEADSLDGGAVRNVVKRVLDPRNAYVLHIKSTSKGKKGDSQSSVKFSGKTHERKAISGIDPKEATHPIAAGTRLKTFENAREFTLNNGMRVILAPYETLPLITGKLFFGVGSASEDKNKAGLASAASRMLRPAGAIQTDGSYSGPMDIAGIRYYGSSNDDFTVFTASGINLYLDVMIRGLERWMKAGEYNQLSLERWQKRVKNSFQSNRFRAETELSKQVYAAIFGEDHVYTTNGMALNNTVGNVDKDAVTSFQRRHYNPKNATFILSGNFEPEAAEKKIRSTFGGWNGKKTTAPSLDIPVRSQPKYIGVITKKQASSELRVAYPAPSGIEQGTDVKGSAVRSIMTIMLNSQVGKIREKLGASYGMYARLTRNVGPSMYQISGPVDSARLGEVLSTLRTAIINFKNGENLEEDFVIARRQIIRRMVGESTATSDIANRLVAMALYQRPLDYENKLLEAVANTTIDDVKAILKTELLPEQEAIVLLSDKETLEKSFAAANLTDVVYVDKQK